MRQNQIITLKYKPTYRLIFDYLALETVCCLALTKPNLGKAAFVMKPK